MAVRVAVTAGNAGPAKSRDILILTASTGAGHDSVAAALQEALHDLAPEVGVCVLDPLVGSMGNGRLSAGRWYEAMVAYAPWLWSLFYYATDNRWAVRLGMATAALLWARRLRSVIQAERPEMVIAVHPICARLAAAVLRTIPDAPPLHCVVTDLVTIHRCWACEAVDAFYVATPDARNALVAMDIADERIQVTGLPVRASFARAPHPPADGAGPNVLILGGASPSRRVEKVVHALVASDLSLHLVVVCGRNARLRRRLVRAVGDRATVLGWCDDVAALMRWSSVVITKAGPTTLAEALSQARPVLVYQVLLGQEGGNVTLVERSGTGCYIPDVGALVRAVTMPSCIRPVRNAAQAAWWGSAARRVATRLLAARADLTSLPHYAVSSARAKARM
jgi:1,2-diacylglycerol 3-beta-galactosyltransferase